eukprot:TRINITY_DN51147_c0_g1_i1.p1 TRINITY_DN51147_c0_g1~~TRINITY_DN51147_c0_g1_i1.p1  ORF type:complete len:289 (-),score=17.39 TRINITY_DN51147_c0_g1_i1:320-1186(-)
MAQKLNCSTLFIKWMNVLTLILGVVLIVTAGVLYSRKGTACVTFLQGPLIALGVLVFVVSLFGLLGIVCGSSFMLWMYMVLLGFITMLFIAFTIFAFTVSDPGTGTTVNGVEFKQYYIGSYSKWLQRTIDNSATWTRVQTCMVDATFCQELNLRFPDLSQYKAAQLSPTESGCCRPPLECGFRQMTATIFLQEGPARSNNSDCERYGSDDNTMCFACDSCKAGVAEYVKQQWMKVAYLLLAVTLVLVVLCVVGACATYYVEMHEDTLELEMLAKPARHKSRRRVSWAV